MLVMRCLNRALRSGSYCRIEASIVGRIAAKPIVQRLSCRLHSTEWRVDTIERHFVQVGNEIKGLKRQLSNVWLRDSCRCPQCVQPTGQSSVDLSTLDLNVEAQSVQLNGDHLRITWSDGHRSEYSVTALNSAFEATSSKTPLTLWSQQHWQKHPLPTVPFQGYLTDDSVLKAALRHLLQYGFLLINQVPSTAAATQQVAERISFIQETFFGRLWEFTSNRAYNDSAYTTEAIGPHTDNAYLYNQAGLQVFHVLSHDGEGGKSQVVDGFYCANLLKSTRPDEFRIITQTPVTYSYTDNERRNYYSYSAPLIEFDAATQTLTKIRYNYIDRVPLVHADVERTRQLYQALQSFMRLINDPNHHVWMQLAPDEVFIVDNFRALHGRSNFTGKRVVCGAYLPRDDWLSKARGFGLL